MSRIPFCPLMSAGNQTCVVCAQEECAWYMKSYKTCCMYLIGHNAALDIKEKQNQKTPQ